MCETLHDRVANSGFVPCASRAAGRHRMRTTCPAGGLRGGGVKRIVFLAVVLTAAFSFACGGADSAGKPSGAAANTAVATPTLASRTSAAPPASTPGTDAAKAATAAAEPSAAPATPAAPPTPTAVASGGATPVTPVPATPTAVAPTQAPSLPQTRSVGITEFNQFSPSSVTIAAGGTVDWAWSSSQYHDVTGVDFAGSSKTEKAGSFSMTFPNPGTYRYECQVHASFGMRGTVIVQ